MSVFAFQISTEILVLGAIRGLTYALLAMGLVLVYRATRVINLAHAQIGAFGAAFMGLLVARFGWPYFVAFPLGLATGAAVGAAVELTIVRRLFDSSRLIILIATVGTAQLLLAFQQMLPTGRMIPVPYPTPLDIHVTIGNLVLGSEHLMIVIVVVPVMAGLGWFLTRSRYGIAIRASAANPDAAELVGISTRAVSTLVWTLAGALSGLTMIPVNPLQHVQVGRASGAALGLGLLLPVFCAAAIGWFESFSLAVAGGIAVGIVEHVVLSNYATGVDDAVLFVALAVILLVRRSGATRDRSGTLSLDTTAPPIPRAVAAMAIVRRGRVALIGVVVVVAAVAPLVLTRNSTIFSMSRVLTLAIISLSVTVLTGWAGQLSLAQFAFAGLGAMVTAALVQNGVRFEIAVAYAIVAGAVAAAVVGIPALRASGLMLSVTSLGFAVAAWAWLLRNERFVGENGISTIPRSSVFGLGPQRSYYWLCLASLVIVAVLVHRVRHGGVGRSIIGVRDNEQRAAAFGIGPVGTKLLSFAVAGGIAAFGGALLGGATVDFAVDDFSPEMSLTIIAVCVIGGLGSVTGALLGTLYVAGVPALFGSTSEAAMLTSGIGLLVLILYLPSGLAGLVFTGRDLLLRRFAIPPPEADGASAPTADTVPARPRTADDDADAVDTDVAPLEVHDLSVHFGGLVALDRVDLRVGHGEVVGLIGSNGAGKSTLMDAIGGFLRPEEGTVTLFGEDVTATPAHVRATAGTGRSFQDARLVPSLTVRDTVLTSLEVVERSELVPSALGLPPARRAERAKAARADAVIEQVGLGRYRDHEIARLSTGTRRIVELACLIAQGSRLLLLDEPTAGVAQRDSEAFGPLLVDVARQLDASILLIEHDLPMVLGLSDRVYCMSSGRVIASGDPDTVASDPDVIAAYLGTDERAIHRSDTTPRSSP